MTPKNEFVLSMLDYLPESWQGRARELLNKLGMSRIEDTGEKLGTVEGRLQHLWADLGKVAKMSGSEHRGGWEDSPYSRRQHGYRGGYFDGMMNWNGEKTRVGFESFDGLFDPDQDGGRLEGSLSGVDAYVGGRRGEERIADHGFISVTNILDPRVELHGVAVPKMIRDQGVEEVMVDKGRVSAWLENDAIHVEGDHKYGDPRIMVGYYQDIDGERAVNEVAICCDSWSPQPDGSKPESRWIRLTRGNAGVWKVRGYEDVEDKSEWNLEDSWGRRALIACVSGEDGAATLTFKMGGTNAECRLPVINPEAVVAVGENFARAVKAGA